jgi:hypothetical protein
MNHPAILNPPSSPLPGRCGSGVPAATGTPATGILTLTANTAKALWGAVHLAQKQPNLPTVAARDLDTVEHELLDLYVRLNAKRSDAPAFAPATGSESASKGDTNGS